ncbi:adhesion G-protein coupled receptor G2-like [Ciona intestinalis]
MFIVHPTGIPRIAFHIFHRNRLFDSKALTSDVIMAASLPGIEGSKVTKEVVIKFRQKQNFTNNEPTMDNNCGFWNVERQQWVKDGKIVDANNSYITCSFNHLTNFATLFISDEPNKQHSNILKLLSTIGSSLSVACLSFTIVTFIFVPKTRTASKFRGSFLLANLSVALLLLNASLIVSDQAIVTSSKNACVIMAIVIYYSFLCSFQWMSIEAIVLLFIVFKSIYYMTKLSDRKVITTSLLWGWGVPLLVVGTIAGVELDVYRRMDGICWINQNQMLFVAVPAGVFVCLNFMVYCVSCHKVFKSQKVQTKNLMFSLTTFVTFGLAWGLLFGVYFSTSYNTRFIMQCMFVVFNSLQGVFLFMLYILRHKDVRHLISEQIRASVLSTT